MRQLIVIKNGKKYLVNVPSYYDCPDISSGGEEGTTPTPTFDPTTISGLSLWYESSLSAYDISDTLITADGTTVKYIKDLSGASRNLQGTATFKTNIVNGKPVIRFNGSSDSLVSSGTAWNTAISQPYTFLSVVKFNAISYQVLIDGSSGNRVFFAIYNNVWDMWTETAGGDSNCGVPNTNWNTHLWNYNGTNSKFALSTTTLIDPTPNNLGTTTLNSMTLGSHRAGTNYFNGDFAEMLLYNKTLSTTEISDVLNYYSTKYNITLT